MRLPFRLGATSYVYRADLVENARLLRGLVSDVELVLFHTPEASNLPDETTIARLVEVARDDLTFSLHLLPQLRLTHRDRGERARSIELAARLIERCRSLPLSGIVVHLEGSEPPGRGDLGVWGAWRERAMYALRALAPLCPAPLCVENIERYPPEVVVAAVESANARFCLDVGHLWKAGRDPHPFLRGWLGRAPLVHLHGWDGTRDHRPLTVTPPAILAAVLGELVSREWDGVLTLEVFEGDFWLSREACRRALDAMEAGLEIGSRGLEGEE